MSGLVVVSWLTVLIFVALMPVLLLLRMRREDRQVSADQQALAEAAFRANGYHPDQVLHYGTAPHQIHLLADERHGILRLDTLRGGVDCRRDVRFRDVLGCQLLENGTAVDQVGKTMAGGLPFFVDSPRADPVQAMRLVLYLNDDLEPAVDFDLLLLPVSRSAPAFREAEDFSGRVLSLVQCILTQAQTSSP